MSDFLIVKVEPWMTEELINVKLKVKKKISEERFRAMRLMLNIMQNNISYHHVIM